MKNGNLRKHLFKNIVSIQDSNRLYGLFDSAYFIIFSNFSNV